MDTWMFGQIEVDHTGLFTTHHVFGGPSGKLGELTMPAFSNSGVYRTPAGQELHMHKTHWLGSAHELLDGERVRGRADRQGFFSRDLDIWFDGQAFTLERHGFFSRDWFLVDVGGRTLLEIRPRGVFRQGAYLSLAGPVEAALVAFAYYLAYQRQQEETAAGAAAAS
jgi:hypothetical protein